MNQNYCQINGSRVCKYCQSGYSPGYLSNGGNSKFLTHEKFIEKFRKQLEKEKMFRHPNSENKWYRVRSNYDYLYMSLMTSIDSQGITFEEAQQNCASIGAQLEQFFLIPSMSRCFMIFSEILKRKMMEVKESRGKANHHLAEDLTKAQTQTTNLQFGLGPMEILKVLTRALPLIDTGNICFGYSKTRESCSWIMAQMIL